MRRAQANAGVPHARGQFAAGRIFLGARVQQRHFGAGLREFGRGLMRRVVVGRDHDARAAADAVAVEVGARGRGRHHARAVVVAEDELAFQRAGREDDAFGARRPKTLARLVRAGPREVVGRALQQADDSVVVYAECGGARHHTHAGRFNFGGQRAEFFIGGRRLVQQVAAEREVLLHQQHIHSGARRGRGGRESGRPAADHQRVAMRVRVFITVRVGQARGRAHSGRAANEFFKLHPNARAADAPRAHEGLVIKPGRQKARAHSGERADVKTQTGPGVLA